MDSFLLDERYVPEIVGPSGYVLVQFNQGLKPEWREELEALGVVFLDYLPVNTWRCSIPASRITELMLHQGIHALGDIYPVDKLPIHILLRGLSKRTMTRGGQVTLRVSFFSNVSFSQAMAHLTNLNAATGQTGFLSGQRIVLSLPEADLDALLNLDSVSWVEEKPKPKSIKNRTAANLSKISGLDKPPLGLTGDDIHIGVWDGGPVQSDHPDLTGRVTVHDTATKDDSHATHVAGTIAGDGSSNAAARGMGAGCPDLFQRL